MRARMMVSGTRSHVVTAIATLGVLLAAAPDARAEQLKVDVRLAKPYLPAGEKQTTYVKVGLMGLPITPSAAESRGSPPD